MLVDGWGADAATGNCGVVAAWLEDPGLFDGCSSSTCVIGKQY